VDYVDRVGREAGDRGALRPHHSAHAKLAT
jgi:hypothetical protein